MPESSDRFHRGALNECVWQAMSGHSTLEKTQMKYGANLASLSKQTRLGGDASKFSLAKDYTHSGERLAMDLLDDAPVAPRGVPMADARAIVDRIRETMPTAPPIHILESVAMAPSALRGDIERARATDAVEAAYHNGEIYVFPKHFDTLERLQFVVAHHEIRHHGLRSMLGPRMGSVFMSMYDGNPALRQAALQMMDDGRAGTRVLAIEEALADMTVEQLQALSSWDKQVAAVRQWLRGVGLRLRRLEMPGLASLLEPATWTDKDISAMVSRAEDVSRGGSSLHRVGGTVFAERDTGRGRRERHVGAPRDRWGNTPIPTVSSD